MHCYCCGFKTGGVPNSHRSLACYLHPSSAFRALPSIVIARMRMGVGGLAALCSATL